MSGKYVDVWTGFSGADMHIVQDNERVGVVQACGFGDTGGDVLFRSLNRERYRNDGTAELLIEWYNEDRQYAYKRLLGFKFKRYGSYDEAFEAYETMSFEYDLLEVYIPWMKMSS